MQPALEHGHGHIAWRLSRKTVEQLQRLLRKQRRLHWGRCCGRRRHRSANNEFGTTATDLVLLAGRRVLDERAVQTLRYATCVHKPSVELIIPSNAMHVVKWVQWVTRVSEIECDVVVGYGLWFTTYTSGEQCTQPNWLIIVGVMNTIMIGRRWRRRSLMLKRLYWAKMI